AHRPKPLRLLLAYKRTRPHVDPQQYPPFSASVKQIATNSPKAIPTEISSTAFTESLLCSSSPCFPPNPFFSHHSTPLETALLITLPLQDASSPCLATSP